MTGKAVNLDSSIGMTLSAEWLYGANFAIFNFRVDSCMAVDTLLQNVFFTTNTLNHCFIALMHQVSHMIAAHDVIRFNTLLAFGRLRRVG